MTSRWREKTCLSYAQETSASIFNVVLWLNLHQYHLQVLQNYLYIYAHMKFSLKIRHALSEFILAKEELEKQTEGLIKKVVHSTTGNPNSSMSESMTNLSCGYMSLEQSMAKRSMKNLQNGQQKDKKGTSEVLRQSVVDMKEMGEVVKELTALVGNILTDKAAIASQFKTSDQNYYNQLIIRLATEREIRQQIDNALQKQSTEELPMELLIMKITLLEQQLKKLQSIFQDHNNSSVLHFKTTNDGNNPSLLKELEAFSLETIDERARLLEKLRITEEQNSQMQKDLETLIFRIEELELDNNALNAQIAQMTEKLRTEAKSARMELSESFTQRVEVELKRINREFEVEMVRRLMVEMTVLFDIKEGEINGAQRLKDEPQSVMKEVLSVVRNRARRKYL